MAHIPSGTTRELELVTFRQALEAADTPSDEYDIKKWIYAPIFTRSTVTYWERGAASP